MMRLPRVRGAPLLARSFLLSLAALLVAESIGLALMFAGPPLFNAPVAVATLVHLLNPMHAPAGDVVMELRGIRRTEMRVFEQTMRPSPLRGGDEQAAEKLRADLAREGGFERLDLTVYLPRGPRPPPMPGAPAGLQTVGEGFRVALRLPNGRWRVAESVLEPFPNVWHRQVLGLLALGVLLLIPLAWWSSRALTSSMRRFADATRRLGIDRGNGRLPLEGPAEIRQATEAFNAMQVRIQRLLDERTEMMAAIAHDLRTPLSRLSFRLTALPEPAQRRAAADIDEMSAMICRTIEFCHQRCVHHARDRLDFRLLVEAVVDDHIDIGAPVSLAPSPTATVLGDTQTLRRAITNLLDNALKYGQCARLSIVVESTVVVLHVDDDGPGIPAAQQAQALRPFTRLARSREGETGGIGLGLTVVQAAVLDHGGELAFENRDGGGLRVLIRLPACDA